ncbi:MAG: hypothetical protein HYR60_26555 [Acidobacteria bacterium]|nr:hypothetical protein [Acidobacteriota bacterium]
MYRSVRVALCAATCAALSILPVAAQSVISAKSGLIHYVEGQALLANKPVDVRPGAYPDLKENTEFRTTEGRAEILLNPGAFLRISENSAVRMISARLSDTRVDFLSGSALIECDDLLGDKDNALTIVYQGAEVHLRKNGLYRFDSDPAQLRVYAGEADVKTAGGNILAVKGGRLLPLPNGVSTEKFDAKVHDALNRWAKRRSEYTSMANLSAAKYVRDNSTGWTSRGWFFNPYYGMYTYIPMRGMYHSPWGFYYYSPFTVYRVYEPPVMRSYGGGSGFNSSLGYNTMGRTSAGYSGTVASSGGSVSAPSTTASSAAAAPVSREGSGGGRGR